MGFSLHGVVVMGFSLHGVVVMGFSLHLSFLYRSVLRSSARCVALIRDVGSDEDRLAAGGLDPRDDFLALSLTASADDDLRALLGELDCGGAADPGVPTSDEYDSACNLTHETLHARTGEQGRCQGTPTRIICRGRCAMPRRRVS